MMNDTGFLSLEAAEAITVGQRLYINSSSKYAVATASIMADAIAIDDAASGEIVTAKLLTGPGTFNVRVGGAIAAGSMCFGAAAGEITVTPTPTEQYRALIAAAADNEQIPCAYVGRPGVQAPARGTPATVTVAETLTPAKIATGRIIGTHPGTGSVALTLPLAADMDTAFPDITIGGEVGFTVINIGTAAAADVYAMTTNTGWTLATGNNINVPSNHTTTGGLTGGNVRKFAARKTAAGAWTLYIDG